MMVPDNIDYKSNIYVTNENRHDTPDTDQSSHTQENKKLDNNKTTSETSPFIYFFDPPPE